MGIKTVGFVSLCLVFNTMILQGHAIALQAPQQERQSNTINSNLAFHFMTFPSFFSYHIMARVTQSHLMSFMEQAEGDGWQLEFLNETEYRNLVHALTIRSSGFVIEGIRMIQRSALMETSFFSSRGSLQGNPFLRSNLNRALFVLELIGFNRFEEKPFIYLRDATGDRQNGIQSLTLGFQTSTGRNFSIILSNRGQDITPLLFPGYQVNVFEDYPFIARHIDQGLWVSFQNFLDQHNIPKDRQITFYLKDLSPNQDVVRLYGDIRRINIGVLVEDEEGQIQDLDWLISPDSDSLSAYRYSGSWMDEHLTNVFHTAARALVRRVLLEQSVIASEFAGIFPVLRLHLHSHRMDFSPGKIDFYGIRRSNTNVSSDRIMFETAANVAGDIGQNMLPSSRSVPSILQAYDNREMSNEQRSTLSRVYQGVCMDLASAPQDQCLSMVSLSEWDGWLSQLPRQQRDTFQREARRWLDNAEILAQKVLTRHADQWVRLARLLLQRGQLEASDLQAFQNEMPPSDLLSLPLEEYEDVPVNLSLPEALRALDRYYLPVAYEVDVFYRAMSEAFAFTRQKNRVNPRITRATTKQEFLDQLKQIGILDTALPKIRTTPLEGSFTTHYDQGLPPMYIQMLANQFLNWH